MPARQTSFGFLLYRKPRTRGFTVAGLKLAEAFGL
jgi:hypothetical protein